MVTMSPGDYTPQSWVGVLCICNAMIGHCVRVFRADRGANESVTQYVMT